MRITTYDQLRARAGAFASGRYPLMVIHGRTGTGKTSAAFNAVAGAHWIGGDITEAAMFSEVKRHVDEPLVLDDVDGIHEDRGKVRLLKQLCQVRKPTTVSRLNMKSQPTVDEDGNPVTPGVVTTSSPVMIVTNVWRQINRHVQALEDRAVMLEFDPTPEELHAWVGNWFVNAPVYEWIGDRLSLAGGFLTARDYETAEADMDNGLDWQEHLLARWSQPREVLAALRIADDQTYTSEAHRVTAFVEVTGLSRSTYYSYLGQASRSNPHGGRRPGAGRKPTLQT